MRLFYTKRQHLFHWQGVDSNGKRISGKTHAHDAISLERMLQSENVTPLKIKARHLLWFRYYKPINKKHIADITRQLAITLKTGIPLSNALHIISSDCCHVALRQLLLQMKKNLENGFSFTQTTEHFPEYFNAVYCSLVSVGEQSGTLTKTITQLADHLDHMMTIKTKIRHAMIYPTIVLTSTILISAGLLLTVIPQFQGLFSSANVPLPLLTRMVINIANALHQHGLTLVLTTIISLLLFWVLTQRCRGFTKHYHSIILHIPFIKTIVITTTIARWTRTLSTAYAAGMPLIDATTAANNTITHVTLKRTMQALPEHIRSGHPIHESLKKVAFFPTHAKQLIGVGENTGTLERMLTHIADVYQTRLVQMIKRFNTLLEPITMLLLGIIVGALVIALYLPIFSLGSVM